MSLDIAKCTLGNSGLENHCSKYSCGWRKFPPPAFTQYLPHRPSSLAISKCRGWTELSHIPSMLVLNVKNRLWPTPGQCHGMVESCAAPSWLRWHGWPIGGGWEPFLKTVLKVPFPLPLKVVQKEESGGQCWVGIDLNVFTWHVIVIVSKFPLHQALSICVLI